MKETPVVQKIIGQKPGTPKTYTVVYTNPNNAVVTEYVKTGTKSVITQARKSARDFGGSFVIRDAYYTNARGEKKAV